MDVVDAVSAVRIAAEAPLGASCTGCLAIRDEKITVCPAIDNKGVVSHFAEC